MGLCAMRIGEALSIRFADIDFDKGTVQIRRTLWNGAVSQPKTPSSRRTLVLPQRVLDCLSSGLPISYANFYTRRWTRAIRRAGLPPTLNPHALRRGAGSLLLNEGVPVPVVSRYLGHANPGITMRVYAHVLDGTSHIAASAMDDLLGHPKRGL
jgi:integrase